jgi:hypothetical protein
MLVCGQHERFLSMGAYGTQGALAADLDDFEKMLAELDG